VSVEFLIIGLVVAALFVEFTGFYPGGLIVPAYVALYLDQPLRLVGTLAAALAAWGVYALLARWLILFGRRRFVSLVVLGATFALVGYRLVPSVWPAAVELRTIGWVIPGLLANAFERQGVGITLLGAITASVITWFVVRLILGWWGL